jgi:hypothetical protein
MLFLSLEAYLLSQKVGYLCICFVCYSIYKGYK